MANKRPKFYAVRVGLVPGIYRTWAECEPMIHGVQGAVFKSFFTEEEANAYLAEGDVRTSSKAVSESAKQKSEFAADDVPYKVPADTLVAFVDGSFDPASGRYGYGCVLLTPDGREICENGTGDNPEAATSRNVAGELKGTLIALRRAKEMGFRKVRICHDYIGIAAWYNGEWKANSYVSQGYIAAVASYRNCMNVTFEKIEAHTGVKYNEMADRLAKDSLGIGK